MKGVARAIRQPVRLYHGGVIGLGIVVALTKGVLALA